jgi:ferritin-like metal-binding protein YciE
VQLSNLHDVLIEQLAGLDSAERQVLSELPRQALIAHDDGFLNVVDQHLRETHGHVRDLDHIRRLDAALADLGIARPSEDHEMPRPIEEPGELTGADPTEPPVLDARLSAAAQRVEHYEIAAYATARALAGELGYDKTISLLDETLAEERNPDSLLTRLAGGGFASRVTDRRSDSR